MGWLTLLAAGCGDPASSAATPSAVTAPTAPAVAVEQSPAPAPKPHSPIAIGTVVRVASLEGAPVRDGVALAAGVQVGDGATLSLARGDRVALDVSGSGRVALDGPALLQLGVDADGQLLAAFGVVTVLVPPAGDGKLAGQRLATPRSTFTFRPGTTAVVAIDRSGAVLIHVIDGEAEVMSTLVEAPEAAPGDRQTQTVNRWAAQRFDQHGASTLKPAEDLTDALSRARRFADAARKSPPPSAFQLSGRSVDECLSSLALEVAQGQQLELRHKQAVAAGNKVERATVQRELATHGQRLFRVRRVLLERWERVQVAWLMLAPDGRTNLTAAFNDLRGRVVTSLPR